MIMHLIVVNITMFSNRIDRKRQLPIVSDTPKYNVITRRVIFY